MQIGVWNNEAAAMARDRSVGVIESPCAKLEHLRLWGELLKGASPRT
jgi:predicted CoA-binding protein